MELLGLGLSLLVLFVVFGFMVGVLFGFFGMGGSFLITPTLLILGYPASVAIGSGLAFYFGTSVIAVMKHYDVGQVDYKLGAALFVVLSIGIELGSRLVFALEALGIAELVTGGAYIVLLAGIGLLFLRRAYALDDEDDADDGDEDVDDDEIPPIAQKIQSYRIPPMISLVSGGRTSLWTVTGAGGGVGLVSGLIGVGGGFIRMPAIYYLIGTPLTAAVGTSLFAGLFSGAFGAFTYGMQGSVDLAVVGLLLVGSALGARIGSAATAIVEEDDVIVYFGIMMLLASVGIAISEAADWIGTDGLEIVSVLLLVGSSFFVALIILYQAVQSADVGDPNTAPTPDGDD
ncbi:sulfite exporter TauE/SafE family protein [Natrialbaceae archaeon AArc-T1-2]|uniref:sulfite exporter TauE/SafE family protein n=1 Tax=Natrialbaceae archaeon AArc-T1-2 TaxID=3053904 RepID=UPI00255B0A52|nr:sulfite exporter TauE/SafE family protein [Natrialbaceae archaeon AArc-T1-2]WIV65678.1 sulfite exporter TauE/SafE family protein [Natrialbaceae archaeon AArc-T1-2]